MRKQEDFGRNEGAGKTQTAKVGLRQTASAQKLLKYSGSYRSKRRREQNAQVGNALTAVREGGDNSIALIPTCPRSKESREKRKEEEDGGGGVV